MTLNEPEFRAPKLNNLKVDIWRLNGSMGTSLKLK